MLDVPVKKNICHYKICCFALKGYTEWWEGENIYDR